MTGLEFARALLTVSLGLSVAAVVLVLWGLAAQDRRKIVAARNALFLGAATVTGSAAGLVAGFFQGAYGIEYIFSYSERKLGVLYKLAGLWAGLDGSLLFWAMLLALVSAAVAWGFRREADHPVSRRLEPHVYLVLAIIETFFLAAIVIVADPFRPLSPGILEALGRAGGLVHGVPEDGAGLNPLLVSYWMITHPPSLYLGFVAYTVPFAFGIASLIAGEQGSWWIRKTRRWTLIAWLFNTNGIVLGGLWAYEVLGWGGYWAWDPVENASFLPWLSATAFIHSVMIQERRDLLRGWNVFLVALTFFLSIFGTYLTRSGVVSSVHAFASGSIGNWFYAFLLITAAVSLFLIAYRARSLRSERTIDSLLSREAVFLFNNMILIALTAGIAILTLWPKISNDLLGEAISVQVPVYNLVCTPFFIVLLLLTALGPGLGWIRTSARTLRTNFLGPALLALPFAAATQYVAYVWIRGGAQDDPVGRFQHIYPTFLVILLAWLVTTTLAWEVIRTVRHLSRVRNQPAPAVFVRLVTLNNRRYGGYLVHIGLAAMAVGIVTSSMYRLTQEVTVPPEGRASVGPYTLEVRDVVRDKPVGPYLSTRVHVEVMRDGLRYASLDPEKRAYPRTRYRMEPQTTTEVSIARSLGEDFYIYFDRPAEGGDLIFTIFRNPLIVFVWLGWLIMMAGGLYAALPLGRQRVGLSD